MMEKEIILCIQYIKEQGYHSSMQGIFNCLKNDYSNMSMEIFKESFDNLLNNGTIVYRSYNQSYYLKPGTIDTHRANYGNINTGINEGGKIGNRKYENYELSGDKEEDNRSLIDMIKASMISDRTKDREYIDSLKSEIEFLRSELKYKNNELKHKSDIITCLLNNSMKVKIVETIPQQDQESNIITNQEINNATVNQVINNASANQVFTTVANESVQGNNAENLVLQDPRNVFNNNDEILDNTTLETEAKQLPIIEIIGDSHLNPIKPNGISKLKNVFIRNHSGSTTEDIKSHIIPSIKKKRDAIIIHSGCNDLTNGIDTIQNMQSIINTIKRKSAHTKIAISSVFIRTDKKDMPKKVNELNAKLKMFCEENLIDFISNDNVDEECLSLKRLHLSKKGNGRFASNLINYIKQLY